MWLALLLSFLVMLAGLAVFLACDQCERARSNLFVRKEMNKKAKSREPAEPELLEAQVLAPLDGEELPEELAAIFRPVERKGSGLVAAKVEGIRERVQLGEQLKTLEVQAKLYEKRALISEFQVEHLEARKRLINEMIASGALSQRAINYLERNCPGFMKLAQQAEELSDLQHLAKVMELGAQIAELRAKGQRDGLEEYRERYRCFAEKMKVDLQGRHAIRKGLLDLIEKIATEMKEEGRSEAEVEFLKAQLRRDVEQSVIGLGEEG